jgi:hypothetical protein
MGKPSATPLASWYASSAGVGLAVALGPLHVLLGLSRVCRASGSILSEYSLPCHTSARVIMCELSKVLTYLNCSPGLRANGDLVSVWTSKSDVDLAAEYEVWTGRSSGH